MIEIFLEFPVPDIGEPGQGGVRQQEHQIPRRQQCRVEVPDGLQQVRRQAHEPQDQPIEHQDSDVAHRQPGQEAQEAGGQGGDLGPEDGIPAEEDVHQGRLPVGGQEQTQDGHGGVNRSGGLGAQLLQGRQEHGHGQNGGAENHAGNHAAHAQQGRRQGRQHAAQGQGPGLHGTSLYWSL